ncbi:MAG: trigger factor [Dehalococcoidia bacterium]|nr:trigger factor [Dehalococcoidia bacterium]
MKLLEQKTEEHQVHLTAEAEPSEVEEALEKAYQRLVNKVEVPGFRKGKAPRDVLERQVGKEALFDEAMDSFLGQACYALVKDNNIPVYANPQVRVVDREPLIFEAVIPQPPEVTLGDFSAVKMQPEPVDIKDEEINSVIERLRKQCATWETVDRPAQMFDMMVFDIESQAEGAPFINEKASNYQLLPDMAYPAPGFNDQLVDMKAGDEKEFQLTLTEDYRDKAFAGKTVHFKISLHEVKQEKLPEMDTAFAKMLSPEFEDMAAVLAKIKEDLAARDKERKRLVFEDKVVDALVDISQIEFPPMLIDIEVERMVRQYVARLRRSVRTDEELKSILSLTNEEKLRQSYRPRAIQQIKRTLVLAKTSEQQGFTASDEEVNEQIEAFAASAGAQGEEQRRNLNTEDSKAGIRDWIVTRKTVNHLVEKVQAE